jgi:hypothetical protein
MREISRSVQIDKHAKKCADCTVRTDADVAEPYDTWMRAIRPMVGAWLAVVWMSWHMTHGFFVVNGMAKRDPINGHHLSPKQWFMYGFESYGKFDYWFGVGVWGLLRTKHQYSIEKPQEKYSTP